MAHEINLVPDVKEEMIKALKLRNLIFFICIVVSAASVGATLIFGLIMGGQQLARDGKKTAIDNLSKKLYSYNDLNQTLTVKDQVSNINTISNSKLVFSRTFNILTAIIPNGPDTIQISELRVNLAEEYPMLSLDAQANAGQEPYIDYNVLESFKKSMQYMRYDYGDYVDKDNNIIPSYCMIEQDADGSFLRERRNSKNYYYAYWTIDEEGCNPAKEASGDDDKSSKDSSYDKLDLNGQKVVKVWRTPQTSQWYKDKYMDLNGTVSGIPHFESKCITYTGDNSSDSANPKWTDENICELVPSDTGESDGITIVESSNGRDTSDELVLRFTAAIYINQDFYKFSNSHMLAIAPPNRVNVTDSYVQIQAMFGQRASDCEEGDTACAVEDDKDEEKDNNTLKNGGK